MNVLETCAVTVAISSAVIAGASVAGIVSLWGIRRQVKAMRVHTSQTLDRLNALAANLDGIVRGARRLETRVHRTADLFLDEIEPTLLAISAVIAAARAGLASWVGPGADGARGENGSGVEAVPQKGDGHAQDTGQ